jgi:hypothetical protein
MMLLTFALGTSPNSPPIRKSHPQGLGHVLTVDRFEALAATYAFADPPSAKYLTQYIEAHISLINHLPVDLLIGPAYPITTQLPADRSTRYNAASFLVPHPQFVTESASSTLLRSVLDKPTSAEAVKVWDDALKPLPPTGQRSGKRIGFFEQGILTGVGITLFSVIGVVGAVGYYSVWFLRRL